MTADQAQLHKPLQENYEDLRPTQQLQQDALHAMGQMASGIAHDINNALSPVALYTESLLECEPDLSPRARRYLESIRRALDDVARNVARMGDLRGESFEGDPGHLPPHIDQVLSKPPKLDDLCPALVDLCQPSPD